MLVASKESGIVTNENLVNSWLKFADVSPKSAKTYGKAISRFAAYLRENGIANPTVETVYNWRDSLKAEGRKASTINLYLTATKLFFKFLNLRGISTLDVSHVKGVKVSHEHKKDALTSAQGRKVLKSFDTSTLEGRRNKALTALMMVCGLRTVEVSRANVGDMVNTYGRTALFVQGKGRNDRAECVMIPASVEKLIRDYLDLRGKVEPSEPLFAGIGNRNVGGRLTTDTISRIVKKSLRENGLNSPRLTAHSLRHSAATAMLLAGVELPKVQQILRHKNINTTLIYAHALERIKNFGEDAAATAFCA